MYMGQYCKRYLICLVRYTGIFISRFFGLGVLKAINHSIPKSIIQNNRGFLAAISNWVPVGLLENSVFRYGVNPSVEPLLNLPIGADPTNADLLGYFASRHSRQGHYLEIGVSVGKTFWQMINSADQFDCWAFDIEELNPVLMKELVLVSRVEWQTPFSSIKKTPSSFSTFLYEKTRRQIHYICADVFDPHAWSFLKDIPFNIVLSDALHTPEALDFEWEMLLKANCLSKDALLIIWDDLDAEMRHWFFRKKSTMASQLHVPINQIGTFYMNGWLGSREFPHRFGCLLKGFQYT
jgi:hypothetical protein